MAGDGYPHKAPTANVAVTLPEGMYRGEAGRGHRRLGNCAVWVLPHRPMVAETYIARWRGNLYGEVVSLKELRRVSRDELMDMYDKVLGGNND